MEYRLAAQWAGYKYDTEFIYLAAETQNAVVASYRVQTVGEAIVSEANLPKGT